MFNGYDWRDFMIGRAVATCGMWACVCVVACNNQPFGWVLFCALIVSIVIWD